MNKNSVDPDLELHCFQNRVKNFEKAMGTYGYSQTCLKRPLKH